MIKNKIQNYSYGFLAALGFVTIPLTCRLIFHLVILFFLWINSLSTEFYYAVIRKSIINYLFIYWFLSYVGVLILFVATLMSIALLENKEKYSFWNKFFILHGIFTLVLNLLIVLFFKFPTNFWYP